ncbi:FhaA domain-containing protein, partial [Mobilicoccus pelagius]
GLFDRVEQKLERVVNGAFARAFKAEVQPVEIASAMRRAMDDRAAVVGHGRTVVPNSFTIELAPTDYERLHDYEDVLHTELLASVEEHAESQGYTPGGPLFVDFVDRDDLDTGVFRVVPTSSRAPQPAPRTHAGPHAPRNEMILPQASSPAQGDVGLAGSAAAAATAAAAGTAAAARAGGLPVGAPAPGSAPGAASTPRREEDEEARRAREAQRARDLAAWGDDEDDDPRAGYDEAADDPWAGQAPRHPAPATARHDTVPAGPAPIGRRPWLELGTDSYPLLSAITIVGRDPSADITLDDTGVSRRHCEIRVTHDGPHLLASIRDLGSTNGTYLNGERLTTARLAEGDRITLGRTSLVVRLGGRR